MYITSKEIGVGFKWNIINKWIVNMHIKIIIIYVNSDKIKKKTINLLLRNWIKFKSWIFNKIRYN